MVPPMYDIKYRVYALTLSTYYLIYLSV